MLLWLEFFSCNSRYDRREDSLWLYAQKLLTRQMLIMSYIPFNQCIMKIQHEKNGMKENFSDFKHMKYSASERTGLTCHT